MDQADTTKSTGITAAPAGRQTSAVCLPGVSFWLGLESREDVSGKGIS